MIGADNSAEDIVDTVKKGVENAGNAIKDKGEEILNTVKNKGDELLNNFGTVNQVSF